VLKLRPYQKDCLNAINCHNQDGITRQLVALPTGSGKTVIFGALISDRGTRSLVLAHTTELLQQAREKISMLCPGICVGLVDAYNKDFNAPVVLASVQAAARAANMKRLMEANFQLAIADEAHHFGAPTQRSLLEALGFGCGTSKLLVGFTATPFRHDTKGLGEVFDKIIYQRTARELIHEGYLCRPKGIKIATDIDLSNVTTVDGDFLPASLASIMDTSEINTLVVDTYLKSGARVPTICFGVTVRHAMNLAEAFHRAGVSAKVIHGSMPKEERASTICEYRRGDIEVLCNCAVLTEGFDAPETACVIIAKPTRSRLLYQQMVGRGLRLWPNKHECLVLDFCDHAHSFCDVDELLMDSEPETKILRERGHNKSLVQALPSKLNAKLKSALLQFDPLGQAFTWSRDGRCYILKANAENRIQIVPDENQTNYRVVFWQHGKVSIVASGINFEYAFSAAEDFARAHRQLFSVRDREAAWRNLPASERQLAIMRKGRYRTDIEKLTRGQAADLITSGVFWKTK